MKKEEVCAPFFLSSSGPKTEKYSVAAGPIFDVGSSLPRACGDETVGVDTVARDKQEELVEGRHASRSPWR